MRLFLAFRCRAILHWGENAFSDSNGGGIAAVETAFGGYAGSFSKCRISQTLNIMETEKSKIPVYIPQQSKTTGVLKDVQLCDYSKPQNQNKGIDSEPLKEPVFTFGANHPTTCVAFKDPNQRLMKTGKKVALPPPPKKGVPTATRSPMNRYRREVELRNKNKLLETVKCELSLKVVEMQKDMKDMKELCDSLEKENDKLKKFQESCLLILETRNCDPVTGEQILKEEETNKKIQTEITVLSEKLNADLELFIQMAKEEKENLQNAQTRWKQIEEERTHFLEQQQSFHREMEDLLAALNHEDDFFNSS